MSRGKASQALIARLLQHPWANVSSKGAASLAKASTPLQQQVRLADNCQLTAAILCTAAVLCTAVWHDSSSQAYTCTLLLLFWKPMCM